MPLPDFPTLGTKFKLVIVRSIALLVMEDDGCSLIVAKVTNPNVIKVVCLNHNVFITHQFKIIVPPIRSQNRCMIQKTNLNSLVYL